MTDRSRRLIRRVPRAVVVTLVIGSVGCAGPEKEQQPFGLSPQLQSQLAAPTNKAPAPPATFDSSATGGNGVTMNNSFGRHTPADGTSAPGNFAVQTSPPQNSGALPVSAPVQPGMSYAAAGPSDSNRNTVPGRQPDAAVQPTSAITPVATTTLEPVATEPPMTRVKYELPSPTEASLTPALSTPMRDPEPVTRPLPPPPPSPAEAPIPIPPVAAVSPPVSPPGALAPLPSPIDAPILGVKPPAPLKPADPVRPY